MLWEKKTQLARETKAAVDVGVGKEEMHAMQAEIHRMEVTYKTIFFVNYFIRAVSVNNFKYNFFHYQNLILFTALIFLVFVNFSKNIFF